MIQYLRGDLPTTMIAHPGLSTPSVTPSTAPAPRRDDVRPGPSLELPGAQYPLWPGDEREAPHHFLLYPAPATAEDLGSYLPPVVTTFHGHNLVCPYGIETDVICPDSRKTRLMVVTILRADGDETRAARVLGWQGDNDTIHLTQALPGETDVYEPSAAIFGAPSERREAAEFRLALAVHGPSAILDADVERLPLVTPQKALQA